MIKFKDFLKQAEIKKREVVIYVAIWIIIIFVWLLPEKLRVAISSPATFMEEFSLEQLSIFNIPSISSILFIVKMYLREVACIIVGVVILRNILKVTYFSKHKRKKYPTTQHCSSKIIEFAMGFKMITLSAWCSTILLCLKLEWLITCVKRLMVILLAVYIIRYIFTKHQATQNNWIDRLKELITTLSDDCSVIVIGLMFWYPTLKYLLNNQTYMIEKILGALFIFIGVMMVVGTVTCRLRWVKNKKMMGTW